MEGYVLVWICRSGYIEGGVFTAPVPGQLAQFPW